MGIFTCNPGVDLTDLDPIFKGKIESWLASLVFDTIIVSGFRTYQQQQALWDARQAWLKYQAGEGPKVPHANPANGPGFSAHEFGNAVDVHPVVETKANWATLHQTCRTYGLIIPFMGEPWHCQSLGWTPPPTPIT